MKRQGGKAWGNGRKKRERNERGKSIGKREERNNSEQTDKGKAMGEWIKTKKKSRQ